MDESKLSEAEFPLLSQQPSPRKQSVVPTNQNSNFGTNSTTFGHSTAYDLFIHEDDEQEDDYAMDSDITPTVEPAVPPLVPRLPEFLQLVTNSTITTDHLLISFLPEWIKQEALVALTERILSLLVSDSARRSAKPMPYQKPGFATFFTGKPPLWMVLYYLPEQHGSFLMKLPISLTFSPVGSFHTLHPPRFFSLPIPPNNKRTCLIQAVPPDFKEAFVAKQELAFWRGLGAEYTAGHAHVLTCAIDAHVTAALKRSVVAGELQQTPRHFSYLALHYVNIQDEHLHVAPQKPKGKDQPKRPQRAHHSWLECFVVTLSDLPVGRESIAFQALLPPAAPFGTKLHPIEFFGWRGEIASQLSLFRTWSFTPDPSLLIPQPVMRFSAIRPGYTLPSLCEALEHDYQTLEGALFCFIERGAMDTLFIVTDGRPLVTTPSLRAIAFGNGTLESDIPGMAVQRGAYRLFNQALGLGTAKTTKLAGPRALVTYNPQPARPTSRTLTYAAITQRPTQEVDAPTRTYVHHETRLIMQELSATLAQEATIMVANAVNPLQEELRIAKEEISTLKAELKDTSTSAAKALASSQGTLTLVQRQSTDMELQRARDLEFKQLLYETMKTAGLELPPEAAVLLALPPPAKRRLLPEADSFPMDASHG